MWLSQLERVKKQYKKRIRVLEKIHSTNWLGLQNLLGIMTDMLTNALSQSSGGSHFCHLVTAVNFAMNCLMSFHNNSIFGLQNMLALKPLEWEGHDNCILCAPMSYLTNLMLFRPVSVFYDSTWSVPLLFLKNAFVSLKRMLFMPTIVVLQRSFEC